MSNLFLQQDLEALEALITNYRERLRQVEAQLADAAEVGGNVWHDNFAFEQSQRDAAMYRRKVSDLEAVRADAVLVESNPHPGVVEIGALVEVEDLNTKAQEKYFICGYKVFDPVASTAEDGVTDEIMRVSYQTPFGQLLLNRRAGEVVSGRVGKREVNLRVIRTHPG